MANECQGGTKIFYLINNNRSAHVNLRITRVTRRPLWVVYIYISIFFLHSFREVNPRFIPSSSCNVKSFALFLTSYGCCQILRPFGPVSVGYRPLLKPRSKAESSTVILHYVFLHLSLRISCAYPVILSSGPAFLLLWVGQLPASFRYWRSCSPS